MEQQSGFTQISMTQLREAIEKISDSLVLATSVRAGQHAIDYFKTAYRAEIRAPLPTSPYTMFGLPVVPDETIDPHAWRVVDAEGNVKANGVIPVRLEDGERIGNARLNDDGTVTVYVLRPDILDKITSTFRPDAFSIAPDFEEMTARRDAERYAREFGEQSLAARATSPLIITGI